VRRANGARAGPPGPYICEILAAFAKKIPFANQPDINLDALDLNSVLKFGPETGII
jgi:hypothetical protein